MHRSADGSLTDSVLVLDRSAASRLDTLASAWSCSSAAIVLTVLAWTAQTWRQDESVRFECCSGTGSAALNVELNLDGGKLLEEQTREVAGVLALDSGSPAETDTLSVRFGAAAWLRIVGGPSGWFLRTPNDETTAMSSFLRALRSAIQEAVDDPARHLAVITRVTEADRERLLELGRGAAPVLSGPEPVVRRILSCAAARPDKVALIHRKRTYTYGELHQHASRVAARLNGLGVGPDDRVLLTIRRSPEAVVGILAVLMTGAAYVPVDSSAPAARLVQIAEQATPKALLHTDQQGTDTPVPTWSAGIPGCVVSLAERAPYTGCEPVADDPDRSAYVLFTSGTTGLPKGVEITHRALSHLCSEICHAYRITADDQVLGFAPLTFDVSVFEIFAALSAGATLCIADEDERMDPELLTEMMRSHRVSVAELPPALLPMLEPDEFPDLRLLSVGGEAFPGHLVQDWRTGTREFWNGYGPTETTVVVALKHCDGTYAENPPIGRPLGGCRAYVLDEQHHLVPRGAYGELAVAGPCVARGYLGSPELTARQFVPALDGPGTMYLTGDLVRWRDDDDLDFLGRIDRQVKVAGHRIELLEIEAAMVAHPDVTSAVADVIVLRGARTLVGYYTGAFVVPAELREFLTTVLPSYAVPTRVARVEQIPTTSSGKVDLRVLAVQEFAI